MSICATPVAVQPSSLAHSALPIGRCAAQASNPKTARAQLPAGHRLRSGALPTGSSRHPGSYNGPGIRFLLRGRSGRRVPRWKFSFRASTEGQSKEDEITEDKEPPSSVKTDEDFTNGVAKESSSQEPRVSQEAPKQEQVAPGSPLPIRTPYIPKVTLPKEDVEVLRNQVFGFDTFFVTGEEPYEGGACFSGNLRGEPDKCYSKIATRLQNKFGDQYRVFLMVHPEIERPVSIVVPSDTLKPTPGAVPESIAAGAFGAIALFTVILRNAPALQLALLTNIGDLGVIAGGLFGALPTLAVLLAHEVGHRYAAKEVGAELSVPYFIPSWQLGTFGAITRITNILQSRNDLLKLSIAGPLSGAAVGFVILLIGLLLPPPEGQGVLVSARIFHESFLVGGLAKLIMGDSLREGAQLTINPIVLSAWAGLLINAINSIPIGEIDGGRITQAIWGRKFWSRMTGISVASLGLAGLISDASLYWVVLVVFLQRGPISPQFDEITVPDRNTVSLGAGVLLLGLLVYLPYIVPFSEIIPPVANSL